MPFTKRAIVLVSADVVDAANQAACLLDEIGGAQTFTVGLSADGSEPATHFWCSTAAIETGWQQIQQMALAFPLGAVRVFEGCEPDDVLQWVGLQRITPSLA